MVKPTAEAAAVSPSPSLILSVRQRKSDNAGSSSFLVLGRSSSGKTTHAIDLAQGKTLAFVWGGPDTYYESEDASDFSIANSLTDWSKFQTDYVAQLRMHKMIDGQKFDTIIFDDAHMALAYAVPAIGGADPSQNAWGKISKSMLETIATLKAACNHLIVTVNVGQKDSGVWSPEVNRQTLNFLKAVVSRKHLTHVRPVYNDADELIDLIYGVERNSTLAINNLIRVADTPE